MESAGIKKSINNPALDEQSRYLIDLLQNELYTLGTTTKDGSSLSPSPYHSTFQRRQQQDYWDNYFHRYDDGTSTSSSRTFDSSDNDNDNDTNNDHYHDDDRNNDYYDYDNLSSVDVVTKTHLHYCHYILDQLQNDTPNAQSAKSMWQRAEMGTGGIGNDGIILQQISGGGSSRSRNNDGNK